MADVELHLQRADVQGVGHGDGAGHAGGLVVGDIQAFFIVVGVGVGIRVRAGAVVGDGQGAAAVDR